MSKYELALVVNAKIEDEAREAVVEKAKSYVARYGGTVTEVEEWGKKRLAYEVQKMREGFYYFIQFEADATCPQVAVKPPTFVVFVNDKNLMHFSYTRYLENRIRETFGFRGTALKFITRERKED